MKNLKQTILILSLGVMMMLPVQAQSVSTIGGTVEVPDTVTVSKASTSKILNLFETFASTNPMGIPNNKGNAAVGIVGGKAPASVYIHRSKTLSESMGLGEKFDVYGLSGKDKKGIKTAELFAVKIDSTYLGKQLMKDMGPLATVDTRDVKLSPIFNTLSPIMETAFIQNVNANLPTLDAKINAGLAEKSARNPKALVEARVQFEDWEPLQVVSGTSYKTYTIGTRARLDINGFELPYYVNAAVVASGDNPTLYVLLTSDVERNYFKPVMTKMIKSVK